MKLNTKNKAILFLITSAFFFALMNAFVRLSGDLPTFQKMFFRNAIAAVIACIILFKNKISIFPHSKKNLPFLVLRTLLGLTGVFCNFYAVDHLLLSDASILNKMSPFFVIIFSFFILKEKPSVAQVLIVVGAFVGALFVIKPSFQNAHLIPALIGFLGGACAGAAYACVRKLTLSGEHSAYVVFFFSLVSTLIVLPLTIIYFKPMSLYQLLMLLLAGLSAAGGQFMITLAYKNAPSKEISVYDFSQIIFSAALGFIVFSQVPDILSVVGYVVIVLMAVLSFLYSNKLLWFKNR
ncbi:MAG: DMT family transporter [Ruminococcaceae bacterium]|nr:DMT family transporter [Oscillospiraceae bacterium]